MGNALTSNRSGPEHQRNERSAGPERERKAGDVPLAVAEVVGSATGGATLVVAQDAAAPSGGTTTTTTTRSIGSVEPQMHEKWSNYPFASKFSDMSQARVVEGFVDFLQWDLSNSGKVIQKTILIPCGSQLRVVAPAGSASGVYRLVQNAILIEDGGILEIGGIAGRDFVQNKIAFRKGASLILYDSVGLQNRFFMEDGAAMPSIANLSGKCSIKCVPTMVFEAGTKFPRGYERKSRMSRSAPLAVAEVVGSATGGATLVVAQDATAPSGGTTTTTTTTTTTITTTTTTRR